MKQIFKFTLLFQAAIAFVGVGCLKAQAAASSVEGATRVKESFDANWSFIRDDVAGAEQVAFDDTKWRTLDVPHDWSIEGPFDSNNPSAAKGAYLPTGIGWYRKSFTTPPSIVGKKVLVDFDGIYMNGEVWLNGQRLGKRPYGYLGVQYDLTKHLKAEGENVIAVRVDNSLQPSSRWYSGSGIYRHVWLSVVDRIRVGQWGTQVTTPEVTDAKATVEIKTTLQNDFDKDAAVTLRQVVVDSAGKEVASVVQAVAVKAGAENTVTQRLVVPKPALWSPDSPSMYSIKTEVLVGKRMADQYETPLGFRTVVFDPKKGLILNGKSVIMQGVCNHHDLGPLGAALWEDALERRLVLLKEMGCNSIRTAHNPSSVELLEMCNRLGFIVIDETFDEWRRGWSFEDGTLVSSKKPKGKAKYGYNKYFDEWAERDLIDHIRRDRNHPCVIMWSVGNEVPEAQKYGEVETLKWLRDLCHQHDPSRLMTVGCNFIEGANNSGFTEFMDVVGYNGGGGSCFQYEADKAKFPNRLMYASEVPHSLHTRGEYRTLSRYRLPEHQPPHLTDKEVFPETDGWYESSYDNAGVRISARDSWRLTKNLEFFAGEFRWTGFDYLGESGGWPRVLGNFGIIDLCNFPKDTYYFYQSQWTKKPMAHLLPHWTWPGKEGTKIPVWCYTNCDEAELFLNGKSLGVKTFDEKNDMHMQWMVPYTPGELKVVAKRDGKVVANSVRRTAGAPAKVVLSSDRQVIDVGGRKLAFVTIRVVDADGNFVPDADRWVNLSVDGPGRIIGVGSGDPLSHESFQGKHVKTFNGLALAIIASDSRAVSGHKKRVENSKKPIEPGIRIKAFSKGLEKTEEIVIKELIAPGS